jgi:hypothetical protein
MRQHETLEIQIAEFSHCYKGEKLNAKCWLEVTDTLALAEGLVVTT